MTTTDKTSGLLVFVVVAFRYGTRENTFPIGVFTTRMAAVSAAKEHREFRGGKYEHRIYLFRLDIADDDAGHAGNELPCIEHRDSTTT